MAYNFSGKRSVFNTVHFALDRLQKEKERGVNTVNIDDMIKVFKVLAEATKKETFYLSFGSDLEVSERAKKAGRIRQSPYEKAGTLVAVNELLKEKKEMLSKRGGKAELNRTILDLIASNNIPAPSVPTPETVNSWIDKFKKTEIQE